MCRHWNRIDKPIKHITGLSGMRSTPGKRKSDAHRRKNFYGRCVRKVGDYKGMMNMREKSQYQGRKVLLMGDHPHAGETGVIVGIGTTAVGTGTVVKLDNCPHGTDECYIFNAEHAKLVD